VGIGVNTRLGLFGNASRRLARYTAYFRYDASVSAYTITNRVPTPEEMGEVLGLSSDRVNAVRSIMNAPAPSKRSRSYDSIARKTAKKSRRVVAKR
jgi:hypothetical protein